MAARDLPVCDWTRQLTAALLEVCASTSAKQLDGLLGITLPSGQVLLVNIHEQLTATHQSASSPNTEPVSSHPLEPSHPSPPDIKVRHHKTPTGCKRKAQAKDHLIHPSRRPKGAKLAKALASCYENVVSSTPHTVPQSLEEVVTPIEFPQCTPGGVRYPQCTPGGGDVTSHSLHSSQEKSSSTSRSNSQTNFVNSSLDIDSSKLEAATVGVLGQDVCDVTTPVPVDLDDEDTGDVRNVKTEVVESKSDGFQSQSENAVYLGKEASIPHPHYRPAVNAPHESIYRHLPWPARQTVWARGNGKDSGKTAGGAGRVGDHVDSPRSNVSDSCNMSDTSPYELFTGPRLDRLIEQSHDPNLGMVWQENTPTPESKPRQNTPTPESKPRRSAEESFAKEQLQQDNTTEFQSPGHTALNISLPLVSAMRNAAGRWPLSPGSRMQNIMQLQKTPGRPPPLAPSDGPDKENSGTGSDSDLSALVTTRETLVDGEPCSIHCCIKCPYTSKWKTNLLRHVRTHTGQMFVCPHDGCTLRFQTNYHLQKHIPWHTTGGVQCQVCGRTFKALSSLTKHKRLHKREEKSTVQPDQAQVPA